MRWWKRGTLEYFSLVYLIFLFGPWISMTGSWDWSGYPYGRPKLWVTLLSIVVFVPLHFWRNRRRGLPLLLGSAGVFGLGLLLFPYNPSAHTYFIYASVPSEASTPRESIATALLGALASGVALYALHLHWSYYLFTCMFVLTIGVSLTFTKIQQRDRQKIHRQEIEIERLAKLAERERIARDLHDLLGHTLSLIALKAELAHRTTAAEPLRAAAEMAEVAEVARHALAEVRQAIGGLRTVSLLDALKGAEQTLDAAGVAVDLDLAPIPALPKAIEHALAQVLTEAVTNIVRHAAASQVVIGLRHELDALHVWVGDNGRGVGERAAGSGMVGMRERIEALGGRIDWRSRQGTQVSWRVPFATT